MRSTGETGACKVGRIVAPFDGIAGIGSLRGGLVKK
jgi:hypothetical protein